MFENGNGLPVNGGVIVAGLIYVGVSMFVTGPVVGERTIARSGWDQQCKAALKSEIVAQAPAPTFTPRLNCNAVMGLFGTQGQALCRQYGERLLPFANQLNELQSRKQALQQRRMSLAISQSKNRCDCAAALTLEQARVPLALYAGSIRMVTPPAIKNLKSELISALRSPRCAVTRITP
ncbi:MAG: hypothetical protein JKY32_16855 [Rhizobiales bacterium]|nr:hypothetical protein [Hyphomicrobiales bacterium]